MQASAGIAKLQSDLIALSFDPGPADGWRGQKTIAAIKAFQKVNGLVADGIAGPMTLAVIKSAMTPAHSKAKAEPNKEAIKAPLAPATAAAAVKPSSRFAIPLATIPGAARLLFNPADPRYARAAVIHDYLLSLPDFSSLTAAIAFRDALRAAKVSTWRVSAMVTSVALWTCFNRRSVT